MVCCQVKEIEKRDSVLTPKQQIDRLLRPGSTYFNLNPFEVLQVEPETSLEEVKKKYRRVSSSSVFQDFIILSSILCHFGGIDKRNLIFVIVTFVDVYFSAS